MHALASFFVPGLGQLIQGRVLAALIAFVLTFLGYLCFIVPGLVIHLIVVIDAANFERELKRRENEQLARAIRGEQPWNHP